MVKTSPNLDITICPICRQKYEFICKCPLSERTCKQGHTWYLCPIHQELVIGRADHSTSLMKCQCSKYIKKND